MAKSVLEAKVDAYLTSLRGNKLVVCSSEPTTYTEAITTYALTNEDDANAALAGDYTLAAGDVSGRKDTRAQASNIAINASGTATHVAEVDSSVSPPVLLRVTTCTSQALTSGGTVTVSAVDHEVTAPA